MNYFKNVFQLQHTNYFLRKYFKYFLITLSMKAQNTKYFLESKYFQPSRDNLLDIQTMIDELFNNNCFTVYI